MENTTYMPVHMLDKAVLYPIFKLELRHTYFNGIRISNMAAIIHAEGLYLCVYLPKHFKSMCKHMYRHINEQGAHGPRYNLCYYGKKGRMHILLIHESSEGKITIQFCV